ncbi:response regulator [Roseiconus lacunae]|uniref:Response regulator n=1 Tax=Roseiconus lacunae TaxID=2605694 RepID=A0ABT7PL80_9BACT|nr:response regulator [Roseiconus lacunae]MCD0462683.1 response regulator [Roseiconus lacunae]MDM4017230.1 response regulator [Roseiconus lacunae]WRQ51192.1 response regulator [Stieleria sp. HD01]
MSRPNANDRFATGAKAQRVLVVDDLPASRLLLFRVLSALNYDVSLASDGEEAWHLMVTRRPFDFVLTDLEMPELNGLELARKIRQSGRSEISDRPIIIHSSTDPAILREPLAADPLTFCLPKPLEVNRLRDMLKRMQSVFTSSSQSQSSVDHAAG